MPQLIIIVCGVPNCVAVTTSLVMVCYCYLDVQHVFRNKKKCEVFVYDESWECKHTCSQPVLKSPRNFEAPLQPP